MMIRLLSISTCIVSLGILVAAAPSQGSCNAVPYAQVTSGGSPNGQAITSTIPFSLPFRGAYGRIDSALLTPTAGSSITVGPDEICKGHPFRALDPNSDLGPDDVVAMLVYESRGDIPQQVQLFAPSDTCPMILSGFPDRKQARSFHCDSERGSLEFEKATENDPVRIRIANSRHGVPGPVKVVVVAATENVIANLSKMNLVDASCERLMDEFSRNEDKYICIDRIYDDYISRCEVGPGFEAIVPANLQLLTTPNDFHEQCFDGPSPDVDLEECEATPDTLAFTVDNEGVVQIPFDWTEIRKQKDASKDPVRRIVAGLSAVSRIEEGKNPGIWIPGREFLGSTDLSDPDRTKGDMRKPELAVWRPTGHPDEFGLIGSVDKNGSIVHIFPRMKSGLFCNSFVAQNEACMAAEDWQPDGTEKCATQDRAGLGATCETRTPAEYAACNGGEFHGMPCTRPNHCGFFGTCNGIPQCQKKDEVWEPGKTTGVGACKQDGDCTTGSHKQCGFSLFDLDKHDGKLLKSKVKKGANEKKRRGVCNDANRNVCSSATGGADCTGTIDCTGYHLEAHGKK